MVYFYGGFRPSEAIRLKWENIFFDGNETTIKGILSKTKKKFLKVLPQDVTHYLKEWRKFNSSEWVFPSPINKNLPLGRKAPYFRLTKLSKKVLGKQIYPYILRHSFATIRYNSKLKDDIVANQMGHSKSMKEKYTHLDDSELKANARLLWAKEKPLSPKERDELKQLKQDFQELKASIPIIIYEALLNRDEQLPEIKELVEAIHKDVKQGKINKRPIGTR
jgi:integrase